MFEMHTGLEPTFMSLNVHKTLFQHAAIGIAQVDLNSCFVTVNPHYCRITGYSADELIGKSFQEITYQEDSRPDQVLFDRAVGGHSDSFSMEKRYIKKDGSLVWVLLSASLVRDERGNPQYFVSTVQEISDLKKIEQQLRDLSSELGVRVARKSKKLEGLVAALEKEITERQRAQVSLERRESELQMIMDGVPAAITYIDVQGRCLFCNATFARWMERERSDVVNRPVSEVLGEETYRLLAESIEKCLLGSREDLDMFFPASNLVGHVNIVTMPDFGPQAEVRGAILMFTDISPRVAQKNQLEADSLEKSSILAHMSHEFRTPLGIILGYSDLLLEDLEQKNFSQFKSWLEAIRSNGNRLLRLVNDHLDYSRLEAGKIDVDVQEVILADLVRSVVSDMTVMAREKSIDITVRYANDLPEKIDSDPYRLRQILLNVVGNAMKFTERGEVSLNIERRASKQVGVDQVAILVKDTGIGISGEQAEKLFSPFSQAHRGIVKRFGGTGLGLALAQKMARALGGDVFLQSSELGRGSTFVVLVDTGGRAASRSF